MAYNVFGAPITDETLKEMEKYKDKDPITRFDRAHEALNMKTDGTKHKVASDYVQGLKAEYGDGVSTLCLFYNATGDPLTLVDTHSWHGYLWKGTYPQVIANGQWGAFLHVKPDWPNIQCEGSSAGVVYKGKNDDGSDYNFLFSWYNPWRASNSSDSTYNKVHSFYCLIIIHSSNH